MIELVGHEAMDEHLQWVFLLIDLDNQAYEFTHVAPAHFDQKSLESYLKHREEYYRQEIIGTLYPMAVEIDENGETQQVRIPFDTSDKMLEWAKDHNLEPSFSEGHPEVVPGSIKAQLVDTDPDMIRLIEDIWLVLKQKGVVKDTDLPEKSLQKMLMRSAIRASLRSV